MRILFIDQTSELGGAELSLFSEVTHLNHQASVLLFADGPLREKFQTAGVDVDVLPASAAQQNVKKDSGLLRSLFAIPEVVRIVAAVARRARQRDLIYANSQKAFVIATFAAALTRRKLVWRLRDVLDQSHFSALLIKLVVKLANWRADRVIVNSTATGRAFGAAGGKMSLISVAYPGIDQAPFADVPPEDIAACRAELGAGYARLIGVFGRLSAWKGQDVFVDALARLPGAIGVIVGGPLFGEEAFEASLREKITSLGLESRVRMLGFRSDIPLLMRAMDVIAHTSVAPEPFGRVVVEGMLAGKPVVASAAGGVVEIIEDGKTGFLVEPGNPAALAERLRLVLAGGPAIDMIMMAGQDRARQHFTVEATVKKIENALSHV